MTPKLKCNVVVPLVGKWDLITQYIGETVLQLFANYKRGTGGNKALPAPEEEFGEGTSRMQILLQALILPILSLSAINLSALTPAGMDNGTVHL